MRKFGVERNEKKGLPRRGMCKCGHLRWKDHKRMYNGKECSELGCKKCDCKKYTMLPQVKEKGATIL